MGIERVSFLILTLSLWLCVCVRVCVVCVWCVICTELRTLGIYFGSLAKKGWAARAEGPNRWCTDMA